MPPPNSERTANLGAARTVHILADRPAADGLVSEIEALLSSLSPALDFTPSVKAASHVIVLLTSTLGLQWKGAGSTKPSDGKELTNDQLASDLQSKTEFTRQEWDAFGIKDLRIDNLIKSGASYFQPIAGGLLQPGSTMEAKLRTAVEKKCKLVFIYSTNDGWNFAQFYETPESEAKAVIASHEALVFRAKGLGAEGQYEQRAMAVELLRRMRLPALMTEEDEVDNLPEALQTAGTTQQMMADSAGVGAVQLNQTVEKDNHVALTGNEVGRLPTAANPANTIELEVSQVHIAFV